MQNHLKHKKNTILLKTSKLSKQSASTLEALV